MARVRTQFTFAPRDHRIGDQTPSLILAFDIDLMRNGGVGQAAVKMIIVPVVAGLVLPVVNERIVRVALTVAARCFDRYRLVRTAWCVDMGGHRFDRARVNPCRRACNGTEK